MNCKKETEKIVKFIQTYFKEAGFTNAVLGISGGIDSAVVCALLVKALGKENVYGFSLPCGIQSDKNDANLIGGTFEILYETINIKKIVDSIKYTLNYQTKDKISEGNIKARARMIVLYDMSSFHNALVVGTGNKTELMLGYFTHFGDGACALEPIGGLYKTEVKELAKYLGVPQSIIDKPPSAGLWDGQTDEDELGATYEQIDECLEMIIEDNIQAKDMEGLPQFYTEEIRRNREIMLKLINMIEKNKFKSQPPAQMEN